MTERLLNVLEPRGMDRHLLLAGWLAGGIAGSIVAIAALLLLMGTHLGA